MAPRDNETGGGTQRRTLRLAALWAVLLAVCTIPLPRSCAGPDHCEHCGARAEAEPAPAAPLGAVLLEAHFIDVGYGSAILLKTPRGAALVDAGPVDRARATLAYLEKQGVARLDWAALTHFHPDHSGGLQVILAAVPAGRLYVNQEPRILPAEYDDYDEILVADGSPRTVLRAGDPLPALGEARFEVLAPAAALDGKDDNSRTIVLRVLVGEAAILLPGDATTLTDAFLLETAEARLAADAIQVPHHGWGPGSTAELLAAVRPRVAILSVGPSRWPAPDPAVLARYAGVPLARTDAMGTVVVRTDGKSLAVSAERGWETRTFPARGDAP